MWHSCRSRLPQFFVKTFIFTSSITKETGFCNRLAAPPHAAPGFSQGAACTSQALQYELSGTGILPAESFRLQNWCELSTNSWWPPNLSYIPEPHLIMQLGQFFTGTGSVTGVPRDQPRHALHCISSFANNAVPSGGPSHSSHLQGHRETATLRKGKRIQELKKETLWFVSGLLWDCISWLGFFSAQNYMRFKTKRSLVGLPQPSPHLLLWISIIMKARRLTSTELCSWDQFH